MNLKSTILALLLLVSTTSFWAQEDAVIQNIIEEGQNNSQLKILAHELLDEIGPRLVGTPQMQKAHDWAVAKYQQWGISAYKEQWGTWKGWERGASHFDMLSPRFQTLEGRQLAWNPSTPKKGITAAVTHYPQFKDSMAFQRWLLTIKGKHVLVSMPQLTGRPDYNWEEFATEASFDKMKEAREAQTQAWNDNLSKTGYNSRSIIKVLEEAGAAGIISSYWSRGFGVNKVFSARTEKIPMIDLGMEDYGMLYRLAEHNREPVVKIVALSKDLGDVPTFNTIAKIEGSEYQDEYVILSAHFDSWDGGTGATDNGTGTLVMMEAMRILKKAYPNPKRTILVGHWGSEEQGLNGSRAFVEDHPELLPNIQAVFNQDNGTGRVVKISGSGFVNAYDYLGRWLADVPKEIRNEIETDFPGMPSRGGTDHASFLAAGVPAFNLSALNWSYWNYTWHTNRDTYDKVVFDDLQSNAILTAILAYKASNDPEKTSRDKRVMPINERTKEITPWPSTRKPRRDGTQN